jgi:tetratricopeptide (TPR) repeat protein
MKTPFLQLKKQWNLAEDLSLDKLLIHAKNKLKTDPENPEILYAIAEIIRHTGDSNAADSYYKKAIRLTDKRTQKRAEALEQRIEKKRDRTRAKLLLFTFLPIIATLLIAAIVWTFLNKPEPLPKGSDPEKFAFTQWLAKQQMVEVMTTLQAQNPELTFDFSQSATAQSPMEFMQSMMQPDALDKLRREQAAKNNDGEDGDGKPAFQCSLEPAVHCSARDIPSASGEERKEVTLLMDAYRSVLNTEKDCGKLEKSIERIGQQLHWRKSEKAIKADLEDLATECFYKQKNVEKTLEHARKLQCAGDDGYINSVYWYSTAINHHAGDIAKAQKSYQCFKEAINHIEKNKLFSSAYIASRHRESGALAWLYFDDLDTATEELKKGRKILKNIVKKTRLILDVIGEINLDLMETYVTANADLEEFQALLEEINSSGRLTDGYKQIKDTLASIYFMQNHNNDAAQVHLTNLSKRFKLIPEYVCGWDWSGFRRGLKDSIADNNIREKATTLVDATNCYIPQATSRRIKSIDNVAKSLRGK